MKSYVGNTFCNSAYINDISGWLQNKMIKNIIKKLKLQYPYSNTVFLNTAKFDCIIY